MPVCCGDGRASQFRLAALLEGWSYLILLFTAMPLKYGAGLPLAVRIAGSVHGFLVLIFMLALYRVTLHRRWPLRRAFRGFLYSLLPFGARLERISLGIAENAIFFKTELTATCRRPYRA